LTCREAWGALCVTCCVADCTLDVPGEDPLVVLLALPTTFDTDGADGTDGAEGTWL
jgi:hypothetical protein